MSKMPTEQQIKELTEFLRFRSVSTEPSLTGEVKACAGWVADKLRSLGLEAGVWETPGHPVVVGRSLPDPAKRTVLIYGHYDVQPAEPVEEWTTEPFEPVIRDNRIYARGATDNKGQIYAHIAGVEEVLKSDGCLPVNVIFLIEGEEEIGSPNLPAFLIENRALLACDVAVISDSGMAAHGVPTLAYALRGVAALECVLRGPSQDLHSGVYGGAIMNPATAAARLIATLHDVDGRVAIAGFYDPVRLMEDWERAETAAAPTGDADILEQTGAPSLFGEPGFSSMERIGARPTAEVNGMGSGYQGPGTKTVLPRDAFFKLTFRLVPDQNAVDILEKAEAHLRAHCPPGVALEITKGHSGEPYFMDPTTVDGAAAVRALEATFGRKACLLREGGSIPILVEFKKTLGVDCLLLALASPDCNAHSPEENFPLENLAHGVELSGRVLKELAAGASKTFRGDVPREAILESAKIA
jgi:acetylornithine deacetylase/succinyl-diaminopimelate desuccinylase-like protein